MAESFSQTRDRFWTMGWTFGAPNDLPIEELGLANHLQHTTGELFSSGAAASMAFTDTQSFKSFDGSRAGSVVTANSRAALLSAQSSSGGSKQQIAKNNRKAALLILGTWCAAAVSCPPVLYSPPPTASATLHHRISIPSVGPDSVAHVP